VKNILVITTVDIGIQIDNIEPFLLYILFPCFMVYCGVLLHFTVTSP
jgi:hypothetical protein